MLLDSGDPITGLDMASQATLSGAFENAIGVRVSFTTLARHWPRV